MARNVTRNVGQGSFCTARGRARDPAEWLKVCLCACAFIHGVGAADGTPDGAEDQPPRLEGVRPLGLERGKTVELELNGPGMENATGLWTSFPAVVTRAASAEPPRFRIRVPPETPAQIGAVRAIGPGGVTQLRLVAVDDLPTALRTATNTRRDAANELHLPVAVEGTLGATETHWFRFAGVRQQRVALEVLAARLGSPLDPLLTLTDASGHEVARVDDSSSLGGDCRLGTELPADGVYYVSLRDASYQGSEVHHYRLRVGNFPLVDAVFPLGVRRGKVTEVEALSATGRRYSTEVTAPSSGSHLWFGVRPHGADSSAFAGVLVGTDDELSETEPNDTRATARLLPVPCAINGRFATAGDRDEFQLELAEGDNLRIVPRHGMLGLRTRLYLRLFDPEGQLLAESAQAGADPGGIGYQAKTDGKVHLCVEELHRRGGLTYVYRLEVRRQRHDFDLLLDADHFHTPQAGVFVARVTATRHEYKGPIRLAVEGLPGATVRDNVISADASGTALRIHTPPSLNTDQLTSCHIVGHAIDGENVVTESRGTATYVATFGRVFAHVEFPPQRWREEVAVHVGPPFPPFFNIATTPRRLWLPAGAERLAFAVDVERFEGFAGTVDVTIAGLPATAKVALKPVRSGRPRTVSRLRGMTTLEDGVYPLRVRGTATYKEQPYEVELDRLLLRVGAPLEIEIESPAALRVGNKHTVRVNVRRFTEDTSPIAITLEGLPPGVHAAGPVVLEGTRRCAKIQLTVDPEAVTSSESLAQTSGVTAIATTSIAPPPRFELDHGSLGEQLAAAELAERGILREAESFDRGNVTIDHETYGKGIGIVSDPGNQKNFAEYDLELPAAGMFQVELRYAAAKSRPGRLLLNGEVVKEDAIREVTGTWLPDSQTWFVEGLFSFQAGKNVLRVESEPLMSHLDKILIVRPAPARRIEADFDSWVTEGSGASAESLEGNMISVFAKDNAITGKWRVGLIEFDATELVGETIESIHLEIAVDGRDGPLATGSVHSLARLLPDGTDGRPLNAESYRKLVPEAVELEALGHYAIEAGDSLPSGEFEPSHRATATDLALLTDRLDSGKTRWLFALEALEDGSKTARDWGADDAEPKGTEGGPLPPRLVVRLADGAQERRLPTTFVARSKPLRLMIKNASPSKGQPQTKVR